MKSCRIAPQSLRALFCAFFFTVKVFSTFGQTSTSNRSSSIDSLIHAVDFEGLQSQFAKQVGLSKEECVLFFDFYFQEQLIHDKASLINQFSKSKVAADVPSYREALNEKYKERYEAFLLSKEALKAKHALQTKKSNARLEAVNGPCTNIGFETGTFSGWTGSVTQRDNGNVTNGFGQHCIMTTAMRDPYIANLPVVPPGKTNSVRLGNATSGGQMAKISQTFRVDSSNMMFTYRYAVVLEDPVDERNSSDHQGLKSPHFQATLKDQNGNFIKCAEYAVVVAANLASYNRVCIDAGNTSGDNNTGCPAGAVGFDNSRSPTLRSATPLNATDVCGEKDIYYKNWSAVTLVLDQYLGQNVTIEFTSADCEPGGHWGYAYVQAECARLNLALPGFICSGKETKNVSAPDGFVSYAWTTSNGGTIQGPNNVKDIAITSAGTYKVNVIPFTNASVSCPYEITYVVQNRCPLAKVFCETIKGTKKTSGVNLISYNNEVRANVPTSSVESWHSAYPATNGNRVNAPANVEVADGSKYYAVIKDATVKNDTVEITFKINSKPDASFDDLPIFCKDAPSYTIRGIKTAGGAFSGPHVSSSGIFTPNTLGTFDIKHKVVTAEGCADSVMKKVVVANVPSILAKGDTTVCYTNSAISLPLSSSASATDSVVWTSSLGTIANKNAPTTSISLQGVVPFEQQVKVYVTSYSKSCPPAKDSVIIQTRQLPTVQAPSDTLICTLNNSVNFTVKGKASYYDSVRWKGVNVMWASPKSPTSAVTLTYSYPQKTDFIIELSAYKQSCPVVKEEFVVKVNPIPQVTTASDTSYCNPISTIPVKSTAIGADATLWKVNGTGSFDNANAVSTVFNRTNPNAATTQTFVLTASTQNCGSASDSIEVNYGQAPLIIAAAQYTCLPDNRVLLTGQSTDAGVKKPAKWSSSGSGTFAALPDSITQNAYIPSTNDLTAGTVTLRLSANGASLCLAKDTSFALTFVPYPIAQAGNDTIICQNASFTRTASGVTSWQYEWKKAPSNILSSNATVQLVAADPVTKLWLTVSNSRNCQAVDSMEISTVTAPTIALVPTICLYQPLSITATVTNVPSIGTYYWKRNGAVVGNASPSLPISTTGSYSYHYEYKGCIANATLQALAPPKLQVNVPPVCENQNVTLTANGLAGASYTWGASSPSPSALYTTNAGAGISNLKVVLLDAQGCKDSTLVNVPVTSYPTFSLKGQPICAGQNSQITTTLDKPSLAGQFSYTWLKGTEVLSASTWENLTYNQAGTYSLELDVKGCKVRNSIPIVAHEVPAIDIPLVYRFCYETDAPVKLESNIAKHNIWYSPTDLIDTTRSISVSPQQDTPYLLKVVSDFGCKDSLLVLVKKVCPPRLFVPNVLTPESHDVNANLPIFGAHYTNFEISIFNRWGEVIFNTKDPKNSWNGTYKNENMPIGTYPWLVTYEGDSEEFKGPYKKTGEVTIVK